MKTLSYPAKPGPLDGRVMPREIAGVMGGQRGKDSAAFGKSLSVFKPMVIRPLRQIDQGLPRVLVGQRRVEWRRGVVKTKLPDVPGSFVCAPVPASFRACIRSNWANPPGTLGRATRADERLFQTGSG